MFLKNVDFLVGVGNLQRTSSQRSTLTYQRNNYALNTTATYADPYRPIQYRVQECNYSRLQHVAPGDDGTTRSPSIDSIQKDPRWVPASRNHLRMLCSDRNQQAAPVLTFTFPSLFQISNSLSLILAVNSICVDFEHFKGKFLLFIL